MSAPAAIQATFSDFRLVKGRKVGQLVFEVPLEKADEALRALGGLPQAQDERWCGIARMAIGKSASEVEKPRKAWSELKPSAQAAIRCGETAFHTFLGVASADEAAREVRDACAVNSRSDLDRDGDRAEAWQTLDGEYQRWQRGIR